MKTNARDRKFITPTETIISRKMKSKYHHFYLYYHRFNKEIHFAVELQNANALRGKLPNCKGFNLDWGTLPFTEGSKLALILSCVGVQNDDVFLRVSDDLFNCLQHTKEEEKMVVNAISRITLWQDFFKKYGNKTFSPEKQKGLYGELRAIELAQGKLSLDEIILGWHGPFKESQDFHFCSCHMDSKVTTRKDPVTVRIHGFEQLTPPSNKELFLHVVTVKSSEVSGESVIDVIERIGAKLVTEPDTLERFHTKLLAYGYPLGGFENPIYFEIENEWFYHVKDGFPRLQEVEGLANAEVDLLLPSVEAYKVSFEDVKKYIWSMEDDVNVEAM
ncbi:PD-(D/E)XK motif protein [Bacillus toyonensis]